MSPKNLTPTLSSARLAAMRASRMSSICSGSVPSTVSSIPWRSNGSSTSLIISSRASSPWRRARSAMATMVSMVCLAVERLADQGLLGVAGHGREVPHQAAGHGRAEGADEDEEQGGQEQDGHRAAALEHHRDDDGDEDPADAGHRAELHVSPRRRRRSAGTPGAAAPSPGTAATLSTSARWAVTASMICASGSTTTYFVPPTREMTVSGLASTRSMRSGLSAKTLPLWRVTMIMAMSVRGCSSKAASIRDFRSLPIGRPGPMLRVVGLTGGQDTVAAPRRDAVLRRAVGPRITP